MKYFSMFSGIGGFEHGIEKAWKSKNCGESGGGETGGRGVRPSGTESDNSGCGRSGEGMLCECVGFSEIDKYATAIYQYHYPDHKAFGDAFKIDPGLIPDFDLLCGGFPCQAFSIAGKRGGFEDTRGTLFFEIARILSVKRPQFLLLENVKGLLSHDNGRTFGTILSTLSDLGYFLEWQVLNSKDFGVPQNRERVFIVGHLGGIRKSQVFPITGSNGKADELQGQPITNCLKARYEAIGDGSYVVEGELNAQKTKYRRNQKNFDGDHSFTVDSSSTSGVRVDQRIRRLTPTECERLQAYPDGWTMLGRFGIEVTAISDSQRYKCLGNSVTTNVITAIIERML